MQSRWGSIRSLTTRSGLGGGGTFGSEVWVLFAMLFLWQIPHSLAIARLYRDDYARAGFRILPVIDPEG